MSGKLNEVVVNGNRVYVENGEVKTQLREDIQRTGWMSIEDAKELSRTRLKMVYKQIYG